MVARNKNILVVTHERSGTHLTINIINHKNNGKFKQIGKLPKWEPNENYNLETYLKYAKIDILHQPYSPDTVFKSHHQIQYFDNCLLDLFDNFYIIYVKRNIKDVLISYYKFLNGKGWDNNGNSIPIPNFPKFEDWIFMKPCDVGYKYFEKYPDPHIYNEPETYIDRWLMHYNGWQKYKDKVLFINYEDILNDYKNSESWGWGYNGEYGVKNKIERFIHKTVAYRLPDKNDPKLTNIAPNKGIIGMHKEYMDDMLIRKINLYLEHKANQIQ